MNSKHTSKNALVREIESKIKTTMIGALASVESSNLATLWGQHKMDDDGNYADEPTPDEEQWLAVWEEVRTSILDKGNRQIKNIRRDLTKYKVQKFHNIYMRKDEDDR